MVGTVQGNIKKIYFMGFLHAFMVVVPIFVPLLQGHGLSMSEVLQTQAIFALTIAAFEVPSGYLADLWGRKHTIVVGSALNCLGFLWLFGANSFADFIVYEVLLGIGFSLLSGADLALLYDSEVHLVESGEGGGAGAGKSLSRLIALEAVASGVAGVAASILLLWSMDWVLLLQAITGFGPLIIGLSLVEAPRPKLNLDHRENARKVLALLITGKPLVLWTAMAIAVFNLIALYAFWLYQKYWELQGIGVEWFGYIWAVFAVTTAVSARYASAVEARLGIALLLPLLGLLPLIGIGGMALGAGWIGLSFGLAIQVARGLSMSVFYEALNRRVPGDMRATANSLVSMGVRAVFIVTGPLMGHALDTHGMVNTLSGLGVMFLPMVLLVLMQLALHIRRERDTRAATP